jgi:hypothetical protein
LRLVPPRSFAISLALDLQGKPIGANRTTRSEVGPDEG